MEALKEENVANVDKVGMVRFNPFEGIGGNQSFSLAILDGNDNGAVVTSLFSRDGNRVYGKPIKTGTSEFPLPKKKNKPSKSPKINQN